MKLVLPLPPNIANGSHGHWATRHKAKLAYWRECDMRAVANLIPGSPAAPPQRARIAVTLYLWAHMDDSNVMRRLKWVEDWLTTRGYIVDDSRKHLEYAGLPAQVIDRKNPRVELTIEATEG